MKMIKTTKGALITSIISLVLCFAMLVGSTFAWFTDTASNDGNVIQAGTLDLQLWQHTAEGSVEITESSAPIFGKADANNANANTANTLWEPGKTQTVYLSIKNVGDLDMKYKVALEVTEITKNLNDVVEYIITPDATPSTPVDESQLDWTQGKSVVSGINIATEDVRLYNGTEHFFAISVNMDKYADNDYAGGSIVFNLKVLAGQLSNESDSFGSSYDIDAIYPEISGAVKELNKDASGNITDEVGNPLSAVELEAFGEDKSNAIATAIVPGEAIDPDATHVTLNVKKSNYDNSNIVVDLGSEKVSFDVSLGGLKSDNDVPVKVELRIPAGLNLSTVKLYHYDEEINCTYNPANGMVIFETADFSPFTVAYNPDPHFFDPTDPTAIPEAEVIAMPEHVGVDLPWKSMGGFYPSEGLDSQLEAAYMFKTLQTPEQASASHYADWYCDFYVKLDRDLAKDQIFLGGNYGEFGWVGFHNGDVTLGANEEIPLLGSIAGQWTYDAIASIVGEFICGVGDVDDALTGATFTVTLRLTNPDDATDTIDVAVINYTFE